MKQSKRMTRLVSACVALVCSVGAMAAAARENPKLAGVDYHVSDYAKEATKARLANFDLVVLSFWRAYGAARVAAVANDLHRRHPGIIVGQYTAVNEVAGSDRRDDANQDLVQKLDRENWWLRNPRGDRVQWTSAFNAYDVNMTAWVHPDEDGLLWPQWKARRDVREVFRQWPSLDLVFVDNVFNAPRTRAAWRSEGHDDAPSDRDVAAAMRRGYVSYIDEVRKLMPGTWLIGNVDHDLAAPEYRKALDGAFLESLIGRPWSIETRAGWPAMMSRYRAVSSEVRRPGLVIFHMSGGASDYRLMRYGLTSCLMGDGYFAYSADQGPSTPWFDEFDVDLGRATDVGAPVPGGDAWMRHFQHGVAIVNPGPQPAIVSLPAGYRHLAGRQDTFVNDGSVAREVRVPPRDGVILLKAG